MQLRSSAPCYHEIHQVVLLQMELVAANTELCDAADATEAEITKQGGILEICATRDQLADTVLALQKQIDCLNEESVASHAREARQAMKVRSVVCVCRSVGLV